MNDLFFAGGPLFMSVLTFVLFATVVLVALSFKNPSLVKAVKHAGLLAFIIGLLAQFISLFEVMGVLQEIGNVSAPLLAGGLKVSLIAPIYGLIIFIIANIGLLIRSFTCKKANG